MVIMCYLLALSIAHDRQWYLLYALYKSNRVQRIDPTCNHALLDACLDLLTICQVMGGIDPLPTLLACSSGLS